MDRDRAALHLARERMEALRTWLVEATHDAVVPLIETHASWVLLAGAQAYKLKKPVRLPFLDYRSLATRHRACTEEWRLNRRYAPALYLNVVPISVGPDGPRFGPRGRCVNYALHMRRFEDGALWRQRLAAGRLTSGDVQSLAQQLAAWHASAPVAAPRSRFGGRVIVMRVASQLADALDDWSSGRHDNAQDARQAAAWPRLRAWWLAQSEQAIDLRSQRRHAGHVRECHGDLHLENVVQIDGTPVPFDGLEFDPRLRWIDTVDDAAFLAMDLGAQGAPALAAEFMQAYLSASGDYAGLPLWRVAMVGRALVRAQVAALKGRPVHGVPGCADYLAWAHHLAFDLDARLALMHGLPGAGKSCVAQALVAAAGAVCVRSDVERKRLAGRAPWSRSAVATGPDLYTAAHNTQTYGRLAEVARLGLAAGWPVVVDAAFLRRDERHRFAQLAQTLGVPFRIIDCRASPTVLQARVQARQARGDDPSDADLAVLARSAATAEPLGEDELARTLVVDASRPVNILELTQAWRTG